MALVQSRGDDKYAVVWHFFDDVQGFPNFSLNEPGLSDRPRRHQRNKEVASLDSLPDFTPDVGSHAKTLTIYPRDRLHVPGGLDTAS